MGPTPLINWSGSSRERFFANVGLLLIGSQVKYGWYAEFKYVLWQHIYELLNYA